MKAAGKIAIGVVALGCAASIGYTVSRPEKKENPIPKGPTYESAVMNMSDAGPILKGANLENPDVLNTETLTMPGKYGDVKDPYLTVTKCKKGKYRAKGNYVSAYGYRFTAFGSSRLLNDAKKLAKGKLNDNKVRTWLDSYKGASETSLFVGDKLTLKMTRYSSKEDSDAWYRYLSSRVKGINGLKITRTSIEREKNYLYMCHIGDMIVTVTGKDGSKAAEVLGYKR